MGLPSIGPLELIIVLAIALLIVGPGRLPEMGNAVGRTIREFRKASSDVAEATKIEPEAETAKDVSNSVASSTPETAPAAATPAAASDSSTATAPDSDAGVEETKASVAEQA